jgi:hypothetical protein
MSLVQQKSDLYICDFDHPIQGIMNLRQIGTLVKRVHQNPVYTRILGFLNMRNILESSGGSPTLLRHKKRS